MKQKHIHLNSISSTNTFCKENNSLFDKEKLNIVTADEQTHGRGRRERTWISPKGNLYLSFCFYNTSHNNGCLAIVLGIAAATALFELGVDVKLKWPNDLLLEGRKLGGILGESQESWMILGIGINIKTDPNLQNTAFLKTLDKQEVLKKIIESFTLSLDLFFEEGFSPFVKKWDRFCHHKKGDILTMQTDQKIQGTYQGMHPDGSILLDEKKVYSGEIL
ncbi:biotin--[acetyl-CoA-carboxylase] ligase [Chlamydiales bacterium]|nr:biotin--[acetyl-CoA-carboxylase] ligase [Chlamydiales bacterium]